MNEDTNTLALSNQADHFSLDPDISYLNCAYMSPMMKQVERAGLEQIKAKRNPQNITVNDFFQPLAHLKASFSRLIQATDPDRIAFLPSASYGFAIVTNNLPAKAGGNMVIAAQQFPSNVYAFQEWARPNQVDIRTVHPPPPSPGRGKVWNEQLISAIDEQTICISVPHCHWSDGTVFDLLELRRKADDNGAWLVVDGTQSVGALPFSVAEIRPDALICAGYKFLFGPYGTALAYFGEKFDQGKPIEFNWYNRMYSDQFGGLVDYQEAYRPKAFRYNVGQSANFIAVAMLRSAIDQIIQWRPERIQAYCADISAQLFETLRAQGYWYESTYRAYHLFGIYPPDSVDLSDLKARLDNVGIFVSNRGKALRISPHVYNTREDIQRLAAAL